MTDSTRKKLGIIGGVGPAATARLFARVVEMTDVATDQEHLDITILNRPQIPDRTAYLLDSSRPSFVPAMSQAARDLEAAGCEVIAMPCNTAHACFEEIASAARTAQLLDMPRETMEFVRKIGRVGPCGILATDGTVCAGIYQEAAAAAGIDIVVPAPDQQAEVMSIIYDGVKSGKEVDPTQLMRLCDGLIDECCDSVVLACTELSLIPMPHLYRGAAIVDALDVLAYACVDACGAPAFDLQAAYTADERATKEPNQKR